MRLHAAVGRALEEGRWDGALPRAASVAWGTLAARAVVRRLELPAATRVVCIGGATLGGSGKTPLAVACARDLQAMGARVALVGHAYRARPGRARRVSADDPLAEVGDEALVAARALGPAVPVVVGPTRALAIAAAARLADVLVLDGVAQTAPVRAALALLAVDDDAPWGRAATVPPAGDLRAPVGALRAAADAIVRIGPGVDANETASEGARVRSGGAWVDGRLVPWSDLRQRNVGLACALGHPERIVRFLAHHGVVPLAVARAGDHAPIPFSALRARNGGSVVDLWLATAKCALHLPTDHGDPGASRALVVATIDHALELPESLRRSLACAAHLDPARAGQ